MFNVNFSWGDNDEVADLPENELRVFQIPASQETCFIFKFLENFGEFLGNFWKISRKFLIKIFNFFSIKIKFFNFLQRKFFWEFLRKYDNFNFISSKNTIFVISAFKR